MPFAKPRWLNSFSRQLLVASAGGVLFGVGLIVATLFVMRLFQGTTFSEIGVSEYAESIGERLQFDAAGTPVSVEDTQLAWLNDTLGHEATFRVLDAKGAVVLSSEAGGQPLTGTNEKLVLDFDNFAFTSAGLPMRGATERVTHDGRRWYVQFAASERLSEMLRAYVGAPLLSRSVGFLSFAALVMYFIVMRLLLKAILRPLNEASAIATGISPDNLRARLHVQGVPSELRPLVDNFNAALDRLETTYNLQQEFLASAAHELKTPLALIRAQIEAGVTEHNRADLLKDVSRMGRQVQQLLHLAEASEAQNYSFSSVDAKSLVYEVVNYLDRLAKQQRVNVLVAVDPAAVWVRADRGALFTLLKNPLENAIQHSPPDGVVQVLADSKVLSVEDEGPGVAPEDLPKLFTRFWRGAGRRDLGAGLGLSICNEIAAAHGWELVPRRGKIGMIFELRVPRRVARDQAPALVDARM